VELWDKTINSLNSELNPICHLLAFLGTPHIFHVSGLRVYLNVTEILQNTRRNYEEQLMKKGVILMITGRLKVKGKVK
jgi:hypothetical protein